MRTKRLLLRPAVSSEEPPSCFVFLDMAADKIRKKTLMHFKRPIDVGEGDWAIGLTKSMTVLYSRYPHPSGTQRVIKYKTRVDGFGYDDWEKFISFVKSQEDDPTLVSELISLRREWYAKR